MSGGSGSIFLQLSLFNVSVSIQLPSFNMKFYYAVLLLCTNFPHKYKRKKKGRFTLTSHILIITKRSDGGHIGLNCNRKFNSKCQYYNATESEIKETLAPSAEEELARLLHIVIRPVLILF